MRTLHPKLLMFTMGAILLNGVPPCCNLPWFAELGWALGFCPLPVP